MVVTPPPTRWFGLSTIAGYAISTIRKLESGILRPSYQVAHRLADVLEIPEHDRTTFLQLAGALPATALDNNLPALDDAMAAEALAGHQAPLAGREGDIQDASQVLLTPYQGERLNRMLTELLDVSRVDSDQFTIERLPFDLSTLLHRIVDEVQPTVHNHTITIEDTESPVMVHGDEARLTQVLRNLLGNAVKYSPAGGTVSVELHIQHDQACLSVGDEGIGIPESALPNIMQRFYRAPNSTPAISGFGIGLYVVKQIVTRHGGTIELASTEGVGTTVTVYLPVLKTGA